MAIFKVSLTIEIPDELITKTMGIRDPEESGDFPSVKEFIDREMGWIFPVNYLEKVEVVVDRIRKEGE